MSTCLVAAFKCGSPVYGKNVCIPDIYHPGHLPPCGQIPSRTFTIPDFYHPMFREQLSGASIQGTASDNSDKYLYNQVDTSDEICIGSFNKLPLSSEIFTLHVYYKNRYSEPFFELKLVLVLYCIVLVFRTFP